MRPGEGKSTTQSRNARRRRKKLAEKEAAEREAAATNALSDPNSANAIPLGVRGRDPVEEVALTRTAQTSVSVTHVDTEQRVGLSLANKNKKRGFKKAMENIVPERVVFSNSSTLIAEGASTDNLGTVRSAAASNNPYGRAPRLVTPSEKQELGLLPDNMFVTSVELENDWQGNWDRRKKKKMRDVYSGEQQNGDAEIVELDYGTPNNVVNGSAVESGSGCTGASTVDWAIVEQKWDLLPVFKEDFATINAEQLVGWKV